MSKTRYDRNGCPIGYEPSRRRKGKQVYFYLQEVLGVSVLIMVLLVVARAMGWADTTGDPLLARMIMDEGALWRGAALIAVLIGALVVVGKPKDNSPRFTVLFRAFGVLMCIALVAFVAWWGWGQ